MTKVSQFVILILIFTDVILFGYVLLHNTNVPVLNPKGLIALRERDLIITSVLLMSTIVIPVFILTFFISLKYREGNKKTQHFPESNHHNAKLEILWWTIPAILVVILATLTWKSTHALDPYKPLESNKKPITIQVVALRWKWLFIYPEQNIATVNFIQFPEKTPISFELTADDAPMNSFWIPSLSGQIYAMTGMGTHLNILANKIGEFPGSAAEISGKGFAGMNFIAKSSSQEDFDNWVRSIKESKNNLDLNKYKNLAKPSENNPVIFYAGTEDNLYNKIIMKYMSPQKNNSEETMPEMQNMKY